MSEPAKKTLGRKIFDGVAVATLAGFVVFCAVMIFCAATIPGLRKRDRERRWQSAPSRYFEPPPFE